MQVAWDPQGGGRALTDPLRRAGVCYPLFIKFYPLCEHGALHWKEYGVKADGAMAVDKILKLILVILPVVAAGAVLSVSLRTGFLAWAARPLDAGRRWGGRSILGANKTWRGPLLMLTVAPATAWLLSLVLPPAAWPAGFAFLAEPGPALGYGLVAGAGYSLGELPNSFIKRRLGAAPGARPGGGLGRIFYCVDQFDSVLGVALGIWLIYRPPAATLAALIGIGGLVHILFDLMLYRVGVKKRPAHPLGAAHAWRPAPQHE